MNDNTDIGKNIASLRKSKGLTQSELAEAVGVSKWYINTIERGRRRPHVKLLARIAACLEVAMESFLREK